MLLVTWTTGWLLMETSAFAKVEPLRTDAIVEGVASKKLPRLLKTTEALAAITDGGRKCAAPNLKSPCPP